MNAVEIEEAVSALASAPFNAGEFPFAFLAAFGNKETTVKRLRAGSSNASDVRGGVLQRNNIHMAVCAPGEVGATLAALRQSPKTTAAKAKFVLATDGVDLEAEELTSGEVIACAYPDFARHFGFFLPLAGISTVCEIAHNPIDIKATGRLNKLYVELLKDNEDWGTDARRPELNQFMARLIFCFFAESTGIFLPHLFTETIRQMTDPQSGNTHEVISELFRAMDTMIADRKAANFRPWAEQFPYVNGSLFAGKADCPRFSRIARAYLLRAGELDWKAINPDIFGSMIQAVADDDERGSLGLHYTSLPNILKVLDPLFLDDLRAQLDAAGENVRKLKNLRRRIASVRVFDPACGSGNFLVIAYIKTREIEHEIVKRLREKFETQISLENFYGIEIRSFPVEIAKLSLLIAEFQCNVRFYGEDVAWLNVLPLHRTGQIHVGNALRMDWPKVCPPRAHVLEEYDLAGPTGRLALEVTPVRGEAEAGTYICGNPPYKGSQGQTDEQKADLANAFDGRLPTVGSTDYVAGWLIRARDYMGAARATCAFVTTNSLNQGRQVATLWPLLLAGEYRIQFAHRSFKWSNLAKEKAGVTVSIVGLSQADGQRFLYDGSERQAVENISPYLVNGPTIYVHSRSSPLSDVSPMNYGSQPNDDGNLLLTYSEAADARRTHGVDVDFLRPALGSQEFIQGVPRRCVWIPDARSEEASRIDWLAYRFAQVASARKASARQATVELAAIPHRFGWVSQSGNEIPIIVPSVSSEQRQYLPVGLLSRGSIVTNLALAVYDAPLWNLALIASRLHLVWIATVCGKMKTDFRYSNTLGWNTFPVPTLTEKNKIDLTHCAEDILLAREAHFPATIADLYDPEAMPGDLRRAHERNDETLERIYIGRRFRNDTERLEKLFDMYTKMTEGKSAKAKAPKKAKAQS